MKLERPLAIAGLGAVSTAGVGVEALLAGREIIPETVAAFASGTEHKVFRVNYKHAQLVRWQNEPRLRRTSPIALFMLEAAREALGDGQHIDLQRLGIVAAFGTGAMIATRRFYEGVIKSGPRFASPNIFPETVFNSPTSHVASVLGVPGPCYSVLGDESAWVNAVGVAAIWLENGLVEHALVIGAEEFDPIILDAYTKVRWLRRGGRFIPSEGAGAMLLRLAQPSDQRRVLAVSEGHPYRNPREARRAASECLAEFPGENTVYPSAQCNWFAPIERELRQTHGWSAPPPLPYCGDAFTASAAWNTVRAASLASQAGGRLLQPVWGLNEQCSALLFEAK